MKKLKYWKFLKKLKISENSWTPRIIYEFLKRTLVKYLGVQEFGLLKFFFFLSKFP